MMPLDGKAADGSLAVVLRTSAPGRNAVPEQLIIRGAGEGASTSVGERFRNKGAPLDAPAR